MEILSIKENVIECSGKENIKGISMLLWQHLAFDAKQSAQILLYPFIGSAPISFRESRNPNNTKDYTF